MINTSMRTKTKLTVVISEDQQKAVNRAVNRDPNHKNLSELVREWLADYVESQGIDWPDDDLQWGGNRKA